MPSEILENIFLDCVISLANFHLQKMTPALPDKSWRDVWKVGIFFIRLRIGVREVGEKDIFGLLQCRSKVLGHLARYYWNYLPSPPPPQAMLRFDTTTQISTKILFICIFQHCLGGRGVVRSNCDPKKPTLLGIHDYWTGVPTTFDLHCRLRWLNINRSQRDVLPLKLLLREIERPKCALNKESGERRT